MMDGRHTIITNWVFYRSRDIPTIHNFYMDIPHLKEYIALGTAKIKS